jgi:hypothetical protein
MHIYTNVCADASEINSKKLIDNHYYAIASKATILKPNELSVPNDKFSSQFGLNWSEALSQRNVYNALDACEKLVNNIYTFTF